MLLINNGTNPLAHGAYRLPKGGKAEIPDDIAQDWLTIPGVERYIEPAELEKAVKEAEEKAKAEMKALQDENAELKAKIADLEKVAKEAEEKAKLEALKAEADSLNIEYPANIGAAKLQEKIDKAKEQK